MQKRGQLTLFVIIGVLIVGTVVGFFTIRSSLSSDSGSEVAVLRDNIEDCYVLLGARSLDYVAYRGGVYGDRDVMFDDVGKVVYYYSEGISDVLSVGEIEDELGRAIDDTVAICIESSLNSSYEARYGNAQTSVRIRAGYVDFSTDLLVYVDSANSTYTIDLTDFAYSVPSDLADMRDLAEAYVHSVDLSTEEWLSLSDVTELAERLGLFMHVVGYASEPTTQMVTIYTDDLNATPIAYRFAMEYTYPDLNLPVKLEVENDG